MTNEGKEDQENVKDPARVAVEIRRKSGKEPEDLLMRILLCLPVLLWPHLLLIASPHLFGAFFGGFGLFFYSALVSFCTRGFSHQLSFGLPILMFSFLILVSEFVEHGSSSMWPLVFLGGSGVCTLGSLFSELVFRLFLKER